MGWSADSSRRKDPMSSRQFQQRPPLFVVYILLSLLDAVRGAGSPRRESQGRLLLPSTATRIIGQVPPLAPLRSPGEAFAVEPSTSEEPRRRGRPRKTDTGEDG